MKISKSNLERTKHFADDVTNENAELANHKANAYLALESIKQIKNQHWYNLLYVFLGAILGFIGAVGQQYISSEKESEELQQLTKEVQNIKLQLTYYQKNLSKKDSL